MTLIPDAKLEARADIIERLQSIQRQRNAECDKGPRRTRSGCMRPEWQDKHIAKLLSLDARHDTLSKRLAAMS